jgi:hypothetical protein
VAGQAGRVRQRYGGRQGEASRGMQAVRGRGRHSQAELGKQAGSQAEADSQW